MTSSPRAYNRMCVHTNSRVSKYESKLTKLKGEISRAPITVGELNTFYSVIDRNIKYKISKYVERLNSTINQ